MQAHSQSNDESYTPTTAKFSSRAGRGAKTFRKFDEVPPLSDPVKSADSHIHIGAGGIQKAHFDVNVFGGDKLLNLPCWVLPVIGVILLTFGTATILLTKWINFTSVALCVDCEPEPFYSPILQQFVNAIGEMICLPIHYCDIWLGKRKNMSGGFLDLNEVDEDASTKPIAPVHVWILPGLLSFLNSFFLSLALYRAEAAVVQSLRNGGILLAAFLSVTYLRRDLRVFHWIGIVILAIGLVLSAIVSWSQESVYGSHHWSGLVLSIGSSVCQVLLLIFQEKLVIRYRCPPFHAVGWTGVWEIILVFISMIIGHVGDYENIGHNWYALSTSSRLRWKFSGFGICMCLFTVSALAITKMGAALLTAVMVGLRVIPIWILEMAFGWATFTVLKLTAVFFVLLGFLVYNHIVPRGWWKWYDRVALLEVHIRCAVVDLENEDSESDLSTIASNSDSALEEEKDGSIDSKTASAGLKAAIVTTKRPDLAYTDSDVALIYVRRSEEFL